MNDDFEKSLRDALHTADRERPDMAKLLAVARRGARRRRAGIRTATVVGTALVVGLAVGVPVAATRGGPGTNSRPYAATAVPAVFSGHLEPLQPGSVTPADLGADDQAFGLQLLHDVCAADPSRNTVLSPASAAQDLGMLETGATGTARAALSTVLHQPALGPAVITAEHQRTDELGQIQGLSTSNRVFSQAGATPQQATLDDLKTAYDAQLQTLDFARQPTASTDTINRLVAGDTRGLIPTLFDQPLDRSTVTVLTNAIYLAAQWQVPFEAPVPAAFTTSTGKRVTVPTLDSEEADAPSAAVGGWQSVTLPYVHGQLTAYALLPPPGGQQCTVPDASTLTALLQTDPERVATVTLPQFHLTQTNQLLAALAAEGLQPGGNYSGFGAGASVSQIVQKVDISVDQNGTTAAAATGIDMALSARASATHIDFDRPFLFLVTDTATHTPLFLTRIADPRG